jgi:putative ABC transport system substrate-binding protein
MSMRRREFTAVLSATALAWPRRALADQLRVLGILAPAPVDDPQYRSLIDALRQSLAQLGWREGANLKVEMRWSGNDVPRLAAYAKELVSIRPDAILAPATAFPPVRAATRSIPVVFLLTSDPVGQGLVSSFAHPGGNLTGFTLLEFSAGGKFIELLKAIAPATMRVLVLLDPDNGTSPQWWRAIEGAARDVGVEPSQALVRTDDELASAVAAYAKTPGGGIIASPQTLFVNRRAQLIALAARGRLPAVYAAVPIARDGGLLAFGIDAEDEFRRAASYIDRILKGAKAGDLPVQQPIKFRLVINLKTAKTLGLTVSPTLLATADEVIE